MEIGIDMEDVSRFVLDKESPFLKMNFAKEEIEYAYARSKPEMHLCGMFCAKEAVKKTLEKSEIIAFSDIVIKRAENKPRIIFNDETIDIKGDFKITISHCNTYAIAQAVRVNEN